MNNSAHITAASLIVAAGASFATAGSLELDRSYASELKADAGARSVLNQPNMSNLDVSVGVRFGYLWNERDGLTNTDNESTIGFQFLDAEVAVEGDVTDNMHARISFDFGPDDSQASFVDANSGEANLEDAYVDWTVNDNFIIRIGQYVPAYSFGASTSEYHTTLPFRSVTHEFLGTPEWTQGLQLTWGGDMWDFTVGYSDGIASADTPFNSGSEADFAINARFDWYGDSNKDRFADQSSWRGSEAGWRIGAGGIWQESGETNPANGDIETLIYTVDAAWEADGWALWGAFYGASVDNDTMTPADYDNFGFEVGGSVFFSDQWEGFARWDLLILDDDADANQTAGEDNLNFVSVGANYYFIPESHAAKLSLIGGFSLDDTGDLSGSGASGNFSSGVGSGLGHSGFLQDATGEDGQFFLGAVMQWMF